MTNLYIFWKESSDPPSPWTRLTRTNQYLRFNDTVANHWTDIGATTHTHASVSSWTCGNSATLSGDMLGSNAMNAHSHGAPSSYTIASANNTPPAYGLDIIYMDLDTWETTIRRFPAGSVLLSNGALTDSEISRFTDADGKYIYNAAPTSTTGSTSTHTHTVAGTTASSGSASNGGNSGTTRAPPTSHTHTINITSSSTYPEPKNLVTRMYQMLVQTSKAMSGLVALVDGTPGDNWEILSSWAGYNLKSGDSNPTTSGSDTHTQTFSGTTSNAALSASRSSTEGYTGTSPTHSHSVSGTLDAANHVPYSKYIIPARLLNTLYPVSSAKPQIIGLTAW